MRNAEAFLDIVLSTLGHEQPRGKLGVYQFRSASLPVLVYQGGEVPDSLRLKTWLRFVPAPES